MPVMLEVLYRLPRNPALEEDMRRLVAPFGGEVDYVEEVSIPGTCENVTVTLVFESRALGEEAERALHNAGFHTEGVCDYN